MNTDDSTSTEGTAVTSSADPSAVTGTPRPPYSHEPPLVGELHEVIARTIEREHHTTIMYDLGREVIEAILATPEMQSVRTLIARRWCDELWTHEKCVDELEHEGIPTHVAHWLLS